MRQVGVDLDLEGKYLGAAMVDLGVLRSHPLPIATFAAEMHRHILEALINMAARGVEPAPTSLDIELARLSYHRTKDARPFEKLACLCADIEQVAARLRELAILRALHEKLIAAATLCASGGNVLAVQSLLREANEIADHAELDRTAVSGMRDAIEACIDRIMKVNDGGLPATLPSGLPGLDHDAGDLIVFAGDPSAGKSTTMLLAAITQSRAGHTPGVISLEDSRERWGRRAAWALSGVSVSVLKGGRLSSHDWSQLNAVVDGTERARVHFAYPLGGNIDEVIACIRRMRHEHGCDVVYVDYLQAIAGGSGDDKQVRHHIRDCLEAFRRELGAKGAPLTIVVGSQYKKREDETKRPNNNDLYEAAYIHQKADAIVHLWRDKSGARNAWLGKHKDGEELCCELHIDRATRALTSGKPRSYDDAPPIDTYDAADYDEVRFR
jgi:replicative DNA helicase